MFESTIDAYSPKKTDPKLYKRSSKPFNSDPTTFDNSFTKFRKTNVDDGVVYVYENINGKLLYADIIPIK